MQACVDRAGRPDIPKVWAVHGCEKQSSRTPATSDVDVFLHYNLNCHNTFKIVSKIRRKKIVQRVMNSYRPICN